MASFVRAARFCRFLPSLLSNVRQQTTFKSVQSQKWKTTNNFGFRSLSTQAEAATTPRLSYKPTSSVNRQMISVETNIQKFGRVSENQLNGFLKEIDRCGQITSPQALLAFRAMGTMLFDEHPNARTKLAQESWEKFEKLGLQFDVTHYNALLRTYLQNKHPFSPSSFLELMEKNQVQPNRVTYQNLISQYCENGDITGASQILEYMKQLDLPIGEQVFNSLIIGHFRTNEPENAEGILTIMKKAGMEPSGETYLNLILGYIEKGQADKVDEILQAAETESVLIRPYHLLKMIYESAMNDQKALIPKFLDRLSLFNGINQDAIIWINQLISQRHEDVAYQIFTIMPKPISRDLENLTLGRFFIRALVKNQCPVDLVCEYINKMREAGFNKDTINFATLMAYNLDKTSYALELISKMESEGFPVRLHYFWPAFCQFSEQGNKENYIKTVELMRQMVTNDEGISLTFHEYIIPGLNKLGYNYDEGFQILKEIGFSDAEINFAYFIDLLDTKDITSALEFAKGKSMTVIIGALRPYLLKQYKQNGDWKSLIQILSFSRSMLAPRNLLADLTGEWLSTVVSNRKWDVVEAVIDEMISQKINVNSQFYQLVKDVKIPENIQQKLDMLLEESKEESINKLAIHEMSIEELSNLAQTKGNKSAKKWLLIRHCASGNVKEVEELKSSLDAEGFLYPPIIIRQLLFFNALHKKDEQESRNYLHQLQNQYPEYSDYARAIILTAKLLTENGKVNESIEILKSYGESHKKFMKEQNYGNSYTLESDCTALIKSISKKEDPDSAKEVLQLLFNLGFIKPATYELIETMMKTYIERNQTDGCIELLDWIITNYKRAPCIDGLLQMFIKTEDPEKLQKVMDLVVPIHGEMNVLHQLMVNLIECGHLRKARKVLETPGIRAAMIRLRIGCENFINQNKITELEQLVEMTKEMFGLDRDEMLFQLVRGYVKISDFNKAQDVLIRYEEEGLSPSGRTLRYLSKAMKGAGLEISFDVPTVYDEKLNDLLNLEDEILRNIQENRLSVAKVQIRKLDASGQCHSDLLLKIIEHLTLINKQNDAGWMMQFLANRGDVETLILLKAKNIVANTDILNKCLFTAYIKSNRTSELFDFLNENLDSVGSFISVRGLIAFADSHPDQLTKFEELAEKCSFQNQRLILSPLWQSLFYADPHNPKAADILQKQPEMLNQMSVLGLCQKSLRENRLDVLTEMTRLFKHKPQTLAFIKSHIIQFYAKSKDLKKCVSELENLKTENLNENNLTKSALKEVEKLFLSENKPIPWMMNDMTFSTSTENLDKETEMKNH